MGTVSVLPLDADMASRSLGKSLDLGFLGLGISGKARAMVQDGGSSPYAENTKRKGCTRRASVQGRYGGKETGERTGERAFLVS